MKKLMFTTASLSALLSANLFATDISVKITNLTKGISFTPILVTAHPSSEGTFTIGSPASTNIENMAEGGDISGLAGAFSANVQNDNNPASGGLTAGQSTTANINNLLSTNTNLTVLAMMLPTNDGFIALNNIQIPTTNGTYTYYLNAYDSGTEANDELKASIPQPPFAPINDSGATGGVATSAEGFVHIHRGTIGDDNTTGGKSDLNPTLHRWLNPVAKVELTVK